MNDKPNYEALYLRERHRNDDWRRFAAWLQDGASEDLPDHELRQGAIARLSIVGVPTKAWREKDPLP